MVKKSEKPEELEKQQDNNSEVQDEVKEEQVSRERE